LTKSFSATKVQAKGAKARKECFNSDRLNLTGFHNQSAQSNQFGLTVEKAKSKKDKSFRKVYKLDIAHKAIHKTTAVSTNVHGAKGAYISTTSIKKGTAKAAKTIKGLMFANDKKKALLLKRLGKLHAASRDNVVKK
jgi:hypothetical protein